MALPASRSPCRATITSALGDFRKRRRLGRDSRSVAKTRCSSSLNASTSPRSALRTRISATGAWARWEGIVTTQTLHDTSFAAHLQQALSDSSESDRGRAGDRGLRRDSLPIRTPTAFEPVRRLSRPTDDRPQGPQRDHKWKAAAFCRRILIPGTKTVVIGACAPIHPRVGPEVRPDVSIRADLLLFFRPWPRAATFSRAR